MISFPVYQDALSNVQGADFPLYINKNTIHGTYPLHHHDFMELSLVYEGYGYEIVNGQKHTLRPGTVTILLPHHIHELHSYIDTPIKLFCCMFDMHVLFESSFDTVLSHYLLKTGTLIPSHYDLDASTLLRAQQIMNELYDECYSSSFIKNPYIRAKLIEMLVLVIRTDSTHAQLSIGRSHVSDRYSVDKIARIIQHLHLNYRDPISLTALSETFDMSVPYISRLFKEQTGQNFTDYIHALRIKRALSLLVTTNMTVHEIALDVGFEHPRTFSRVFKQATGVTAREYRRIKRINVGSD